MLAATAASRRRTFVPKGTLTNNNAALSKAQIMLGGVEVAAATRRGRKTTTQLAVEKAKLEEKCSVLVSSVRAAAKIAKLRGKFDSRSMDTYHLERRASAMRKVAVSPDGKGMRIEADALGILDDERRLLEEALAVKVQPVVRGLYSGKRIAEAWRDVRDTVRSSLAEVDFSDHDAKGFRERLSAPSGQLLDCLPHLQKDLSKCAFSSFVRLHRS